MCNAKIIVYRPTPETIEAWWAIAESRPYLPERHRRQNGGNFYGGPFKSVDEARLVLHFKHPYVDYMNAPVIEMEAEALKPKIIVFRPIPDELQVCWSIQEEPPYLRGNYRNHATQYKSIDAAKEALIDHYPELANAEIEIIETDYQNPDCFQEVDYSCTLSFTLPYDELTEHLEITDANPFAGTVRNRTPNLDAMYDDLQLQVLSHCPEARIMKVIKQSLSLSHPDPAEVDEFSDEPIMQLKCNISATLHKPLNILDDALAKSLSVTVTLPYYDEPIAGDIYVYGVSG